MKEIWIANDHGGYILKKQIIAHLEQNGIKVKDVGCDSEDIVRYPYYAAQVAAAVSNGEIERGILICSTGIGMSIIANKYPRVRAALCHSEYEAKMTRAHNDSNVLCLGGKTLGVYPALEIVDIWLSTAYMGGRHEISLNLIREAESVNLSGQCWLPDIF